MKTKGLVCVGIALALALVLVAQPQEALAQQKFKLKFQATWPAGSTLYTHFKQLTERIRKMSGGRLDIECLPAGAIVPAFELLDAVSADMHIAGTQLSVLGSFKSATRSRMSSSISRRPLGSRPFVGSSSRRS